MKRFAMAAVALALSVGPACARGQSHSTAPATAAPQAAAQSSSQSAHGVSPFQADMIRGQELMGSKEYDEAVRVFETLTHEDPKNAGAWNMLGVAQQQVGQIQAARAAYTRATRLNSKFGEAYNNIGTTWYEEQRYARAVRSYRKAIAVDSTLASAFSNLGCAYFNEKKYPEALAAFNTALTLDPDVFTLSSHAGTVLQDRSVSDHGAFYFLLAKSYAERNDASTCAQYLRKAYDEGYKSVATVKTDPSFAKVLDDPNVQAVLVEAAADEAAKPPTAAPAAPGT